MGLWACDGTMAPADLCRCRKLCHCQPGKKQSESCSRNSHQSHLMYWGWMITLDQQFFTGDFGVYQATRALTPHIFFVLICHILRPVGSPNYKVIGHSVILISTAWHLEVDDLSQSASFGCRGRFGPCHRWFLLLGFVEFLQGF